MMLRNLTLIFLSLAVSSEAWSTTNTDRAMEQPSKTFQKSVAGSLATMAAASVIFLSPDPAMADATESITQCNKQGRSNANCVSTASVRQVDLYMPPWQYPDTMPTQEVIARLKGASTVDIHVSVAEEKSNYLKLSAVRRLNTDTIEFVVNPDEHFITFKSQQTDGPDINDFGAQRTRLDEIQRRARVFSQMGSGLNSADTAAREGALGQLKAFYGIRSGKGFEDTLLELDE